MSIFATLLAGTCILLVFARCGYVFGSYLYVKKRWMQRLLPIFFLAAAIYALTGAMHVVFFCIFTGAFLGTLLSELDPEKTLRF